MPPRKRSRTEASSDAPPADAPPAGAGRQGVITSGQQGAGRQGAGLQAVLRPGLYVGDYEHSFYGDHARV